MNIVKGGHSVGIRPTARVLDDPQVPKTDMQETENLGKAISLDQECASMCSLQLSKHGSTK
jgi:hypothetical protein